MTFADTYEVVRVARNDALHQGAFARHLTTNALNLAITLEDALMSGSKTVGAYMIRNVECAFPWQPISFIHQIMLNSSFSYLPVCLRKEEQPVWYLVSDYAVARFLRSTSDRKGLLAMTLDEAMNSNPDPLQLEAATSCEYDAPVEEALRISRGQPILVQRRGDPGQLIGILTSFDLL